MTDLQKIFLTSGLTLLGGIIVLVIGQIIIRFIIDPLENLRTSIGETANSSIYYANVYSNPGMVQKDLVNEAHQALRLNVSRLISRAHAIPLYPVFSFFHFIPDIKDIQNASSELIGLSNRLDTNSLQNARRNCQSAKYKSLYRLIIARLFL